MISDTISNGGVYQGRMFGREPLPVQFKMIRMSTGIRAILPQAQHQIAQLLIKVHMQENGIIQHVLQQDRISVNSTEKTAT